MSRLARYSTTAGEIHVEALKRLVSYLYQTRYMAITYRADVEDVHVPMMYENGVNPLDVNKEQSINEGVCGFRFCWDRWQIDSRICGVSKWRTGDMEFEAYKDCSDIEF